MIRDLLRQLSQIRVIFGKRKELYNKHLLSHAVVLSLQAWANIGETLVQSQNRYELATDHLCDSTRLLERVSFFLCGVTTKSAAKIPSSADVIKHGFAKQHAYCTESFQKRPGSVF